MDYKTIVTRIKESCESTIKFNNRILEEQFKGYDGRYYDEEREEYTILETETRQAEEMLESINAYVKMMKLL
jgi:hypothetical protein